MFLRWWWEVDSTAAHRADEREHRRPQVEKRKATTSRNTLPSQDGGATRRDKEKTLSKQSFETAYFYFPESGFQQHFFKMVVGGGLPSLTLAHIASRCRTRCFDSNNASHCPASPSSTSHLKTKNAPCARRVMFLRWWWEVDSTAAHRADEREHRRP